MYTYKICLFVSLTFLSYAFTGLNLSFNIVVVVVVDVVYLMLLSAPVGSREEKPSTNQ